MAATIKEFVQELRKHGGQMRAELATTAIRGIGKKKDYWKAVGRAQGIEDALELAMRIYQRIELDDDDPGSTLGAMPNDRS